MASITTDLICNLNHLVEVKYLEGNMFSMDNAGNIINVHVYDENGSPVTLIGNVTANVILSNGGTVTVTGAIEGNKAYVILPQAAYAVPGAAVIVVKLTHGTTVTTLAAVVVNIYRSTTGTPVDPGTIIPSVEALINLINTTRDSLPPTYAVMWQTFAPTFDPEKTGGYTIGEYCTKDSVLYKCKNPHTGVWNASNFEATNVGKELYENYEKTFELLSENTRNLWKWGDQTVTGTKRAAENAGIPAGTYTVSARITRADSGSSRIVFYKNSVASGNVLANPTIAVSTDGSRYYTTVTLAEQADIIVVYSAVNSTGTNQAIWHDIQLESGYTATPYVPYVTAKDAIARENAASANELKGYFLKQADLVDPLASENDGLGFYSLYSGGFSPDTGANVTATNRCRTRTIRIDQPVRVSFNNPNYILRIWGYSEYDGQASGTEPFVKDQSEPEYYIIPTLSTTKYIRICFYRKDGAVITTDVSDSTSDFYIINHTLRICNLTDKLLKEIGVPADAKIVGNQLKHYNTYDYLAAYSRYYSVSSSGITFTWNSDNTSCHAEGTATSVAATRMFGSTSIILPGIVSGNTYYVSCKTTNENLLLEIIFYFNNSTTGAISYIISNEQEITVPEDITGTYIRIRVNNGATVDADISDISIRNALTNEQLTEKSKIAAYIDGEYDNMTVGNAKQLVATVGVEDHAPYVFRTAGGSADIGDRLVDKLIGGTVVWNQLIYNTNFNNAPYPTGATRTYDSETDSVSVSATTNSYKYVYASINQSALPKIAGHIYLISSIVETENEGNVWFKPCSSTTTPPSQRYIGKNRYSFIQKVTGNSQGLPGSTVLGYSVASEGESVTVTFSKATMYDLTMMFGSTIAEYIYSLETANVGAGVAWFKKIFPNEYYTSNAGTLMSVNVASHKMIGFNQWDEVWANGFYHAETGAYTPQPDQPTLASVNKIKVIGGMTYCFTVSGGLKFVVFEYDINGTYIRRTPQTLGQFTLLPETDTIAFHIANYGNRQYRNDVCVNLSWDGERDGEYEEHAEYEYPIADVELRGELRLDSNNELYYYGDEYESDGTITRRHALVDLSTVTLTARATGDVNKVYSFVLPKNYYASLASSGNVYFVSDKYSYFGSSSAANLTPIVDTASVGIYSYINSNNLTTTCYLVAPKTDTVSGYLLYRVAEPYTEEADSFQNPQFVDDFGTEEYVDRSVLNQIRDVSMPTGHSTIYKANLRAKLEMAPNSPGHGDGDYVVRHVDGANEYVKVDNSEIDEKFARKIGNYPELTSGTSNQLASKISIVDTDPYNFRTAGGSVDIGDRLEDKLIGGTIVWNQLVEESKKSATITPSGTQYYSGWSTGVYPEVNHVYAIHAKITYNGSKLPLRVYVTMGVSNVYAAPAIDIETAGITEVWFTGTTSTTPTSSMIVGVSNLAQMNLTSEDAWSIDEVTIMDFTKMFGTTIGTDYFLSLNHANRKKWFHNLFPNSYYAYDPGSLQSVNVASHNTVGFNAWDGEYESGGISQTTGEDNTSAYIRSKNYIPIVPGMNYYFNNGGGSTSYTLRYYDANKAYIGFRASSTSSEVFTTPDNCGYVRFVLVTSIYPGGVCINLSWDGERDGEYAPYEKHEYILDDVELRGVLKLDAENNLYYDGDEYTSDGAVTRKYKAITLDGTTPYRAVTATALHSTTGLYYSTIPLATTEIGVNTPADAPNMVASKFICQKGVGLNNIYVTSAGGVIAIVLQDQTITTVAGVNAWLAANNVDVIYELASAVTETIEPFQNPQIVDDFGTEEYIDRGVLNQTRDVAIPVGHETKYQPNLRAKLEMAPNSPGDGDGDYVVRQRDGVNEYVKWEDSEINDEIRTLAKKDGEYDDFVAGNSKQLMSTIVETDNEPYTFRTSGGSIDIGDRMTDKLIGGSIVWNQCAYSSYTEANDLVIPISTTYTSLSAANGVLTCTKLGSTSAHGFYDKHILPVPGHKYYIRIGIKPSEATTVRYFSTSAAGGAATAASGGLTMTISTANAWTQFERIISIGSSSTAIGALLYLDSANAMTTNSTVSVRQYNIFDLTLMFGPTIADYIYSLEQTTAGAGIAWFKKLFPNVYYDFKARTMMSVKAASHNTVGFNQWDEEWESGNINQSTGEEIASDTTIRSKNYIKIIPGNSYYFKTPLTIGLRYYNENKEFIATDVVNNGKKTPPNNGLLSYTARYLRIVLPNTTVYENNVCIHFAWDNSRNGEYEPYEMHEYALGDTELRGILMLDANNNLYYDGDEYTSDGKIKRKYGIVDLGTLTWRASSTENIFYVSNVNSEVPFLHDSSAKAICSKYVYGGAVESSAGITSDKTICISFNTENNRLFVKDTSSNNDLTTFASGLNGVYLIYELATPVIESSDPFQNPQVVDDFGTEEYVDRGILDGTRTIAIPVGHETEYQPNLRAKLEMVPDSPGDGDGDYVVRQVDGENEYVKWEDSEINAEIRTLAKKDGVYDELTAGTSKQLASTVSVTDISPYLFRTAGGSADIGDRMEDKLIGGTINWNQKLEKSGYAASTTTNGITFTNNNDGSISVSGTASARAIFSLHNVSAINPHVYLLDSSVDVSGVWVGNSTLGVSSKLFKHTTTSGAAGINVMVESGTAITGTIKVYPQVFDLTLMFGSAIANYIYGLETSTAGAGVAWFRNMFPKKWYPFNAGTLMSVQAMSHNTIGFNAWDEEWEVGSISSATGENSTSSDQIRSKNYIKVIPGATYYFKSANTLGLRYYDADKKFLSYTTVFNATRYIPKNCYYLRFIQLSTTTYLNGICINLHWDGERDGEYEPYVKHEYALGNVELRGIPKLDANNDLYYDGDEYSSNGSIVRKYGFIANLKSLTWTATSAYGNRYRASADLAEASNDNPTTGRLVDALCSGLEHSMYVADAAESAEANTFGIRYDKIYVVFGSSKTASAVKTALNGMSLLYPLKSVTTETSDPFQNPQIVDDWGTEAYVDREAEYVNTEDEVSMGFVRDVAIPVGHETKYQPNLRAKLEMAPDSPGDGNGDYVVRQTNGVNEYVKIDPSNIYPARPYIDGEYFLQAVFDGPHGITYRWQKVSSISGVSF